MNLLLFGKLTEHTVLPSIRNDAVVTLQPNEDKIIRNIKLQYHHPTLILPTGYTSFYKMYINGTSCCYVENEYFFSKLQKRFDILFCNDIHGITQRALSYIQNHQPSYLFHPSVYAENEHHFIGTTKVIGIATHYIHTI